MVYKQIFIDIKDGKHPCISSDNFIPNDTLIAKDQSSSVIILTGPNMGGKSTLMRQIGLLTIMAQIVSLLSISYQRETRLIINEKILIKIIFFL